MSCLGIHSNQFESALEDMKHARGVELDTELTAEDLQELVKEFKQIVRTQGKQFPEDPWEQLWGAIGAVFGSWMNPRAITYRKLNDIPENGAPQSMFSPWFLATWAMIAPLELPLLAILPLAKKNSLANSWSMLKAKTWLQEFALLNPSTMPPVMLRLKNFPPWKSSCPRPMRNSSKSIRSSKNIIATCRTLSSPLNADKLFMLQTRSGKRTAAASLRIAVDMVKESLITKQEAILRIKPEQLDQLLHPCLDPNAKKDVIAKGLPASPGAATGQIVFDPETAEKWVEERRQKSHLSSPRNLSRRHSWNVRC